MKATTKPGNAAATGTANRPRPAPCAVPLALALMLSGCATTAHEYATCTSARTETLTFRGQTTHVQRCTEWQFAPSREQAQRFEARQLTRSLKP